MTVGDLVPVTRHVPVNLAGLASPPTVEPATRVFTVRIYGHPVAQPRAGRRHFIDRLTQQPRSVAYDPVNAKDWKRSVLVQALAAQPPAMYRGPLAVSLDFILARPQRLPKRVRHHVTKPDLDNLTKAIFDSLRGRFYLDDKQIVRLSASKTYGPEPGVVIRLAPDPS